MLFFFYSVLVLYAVNDLGPQTHQTTLHEREAERGCSRAVFHPPAHAGMERPEIVPHFRRHES